MLDIINLPSFQPGTDYEIRIFSTQHSYKQGECTAILGANGCGKVRI